MVRVHMPPGKAHQFHRHPTREEILYVEEGEVEQWVGRERRVLRAGESAFIPRDEVHGSYNISGRGARFLAILSPAVADGPMLVEVQEDEPWRSLKKPFAYGPPVNP